MNLIKGLPGTPALQGDFVITDTDETTPLFTIDPATGDVDCAGTLTANAVVDGAGAVELASTLDVAGNFSVATNKATIAAATGNTALAGTLNVVGNLSVATNKATIAAASGNTALAGTLDVAGLITSTVAAGSPVVKLTLTSDTPTVAFTDDGTAGKAPTTAPAGYIEIIVGATPYYIPVWA